MRHDDLKIWLCGNSNFQEHEIMKNNKDVINLFDVNKPCEGENINEYNKIFNEFVCWYYIWKNNLQSKFIATGHYSRIPGEIDLNALSLNKIQYFFNDYKCNYATHLEDNKFAFIISQVSQFGGPNFLWADVIEYLLNQTKVNINDIISVTQYNHYYTFASREIFACKWEIFCDMIEFVYGFLQFVENKYNLHSLEDWKNHIIEKVITLYRANLNFNIGNYFLSCYQKPKEFCNILNDDFGYSSKCNCWRIYGYCIEMLISIYILTHDSYCIPNNVILLNVST